MERGEEKLKGKTHYPRKVHVAPATRFMCGIPITLGAGFAEHESEVTCNMCQKALGMSLPVLHSPKTLNKRNGKE